MRKDRVNCKTTTPRNHLILTSSDIEQQSYQQPDSEEIQFPIEEPNNESFHRVDIPLPIKKIPTPINLQKVTVALAQQF